MKIQNIFFALFFPAILLTTSCSQDNIINSNPANGNNATGAKVSVLTEMSSPTILKTVKTDEEQFSLLSGGNGNLADSLRIQRVRILVSKLILQRSGEDSGTADRTIKTEPMLLVIDSAGTRVITSANIPAGTYDRVKFEIHKFEDDEVGNYASDPVFADFASGKRYTIIVDGTVFQGGKPSPFTFQGRSTASLTMKFDQPFPLTNGTSTNIVFQFNPSIMFKSGTSVLDPRDSKNENDIEKMFKNAIRSLRR